MDIKITNPGGNPGVYNLFHDKESYVLENKTQTHKQREWGKLESKLRYGGPLVLR